MSERAPTPEQRRAIETTAGAVMIEAGAGTGKTGVMVDRYCRLVCEEETSLEEVLTITFTEKAATELRQRIRTELERRGGAGSERARDLLGSLGSAWITTIHGFCHRVLAAHPVAAGVDPRFAVLDEAETERAAREAFDEALEAFLASGEEGREVTVAAYGIEALRGMVVGAHGELRSRGAEPRLPDPPEPDVLAALGEAKAASAATLREPGLRDAARELVERAAAILGERGEDIGLEEIGPLCSESTAHSMVAYCAAIECARARVAEAGEGGEAYAHAAELLTLFSSRFAAVKERRRGIDFEDLQLLAVGLLGRDDVGGLYRGRFKQVMVDEFQDTNRLQLRLIDSLRGPETKLMVVGDALQSIYGFRHADLGAFAEQREAIDADPDGETIELTGNFRSRPEVIGAVNAIGSELMDGEYRALSVGAPPPGETAAGAGSAVELLLTQADGWDAFDLEAAVDSGTSPQRLAEARFLALRMRELAEAGVSRGEMVVLLRAFTHLDAYEDSLARAGLRPYVVGGRGYWSQQQVADACALLATIANPLDDQALFGALASPACGVAPDTLWLLRAASGADRHIWPAVELATGLREGEVEAPERLGQIPEAELVLLRGFAETIREMRALGTRLPLADLIDRAVSATGYDLAVLLKPDGEARFANVRKLMQIAEEFEAREGRDLRGLLDFLALRGEADDESTAATAAEDHDGVRIMSIHRAKGLEFGVVAVPQLDRSLLEGAWPPLLTFGRGEDGRVGMQLRRLGAGSINLYDHEALREEAREREAEEGLRLFHVAATRAVEKLILSGVVREKASEPKASTPVIERIVETFDIDRAVDSSVSIPPPQARPGLDASFQPSEIAVTVNAPSPQHAAELVARRRSGEAERQLGMGPAPLLRRSARKVPRGALSYSAISEYERCGYRFQLERIFGLGREIAAVGSEEEAGAPSAREERTARGRIVHSLLEWSQANGWQEPSRELVERHVAAEGLDAGTALGEELPALVRGWLGSELFAERLGNGAAVRTEVPILLDLEGSMLRGSIDLLVEEDGVPPLVVDYKTDRLGSSSPAERVDGYETQRAIYALAVAEARGADEVEVAYVFLERPAEPQLERLGPPELDAARIRLAAAVNRIAEGEFAVAPLARRTDELCRRCPARGRACSGPQGSPR